MTGDPHTVAQYISTTAATLATYARKSGLTLSAYILDMAVVEAQETAEQLRCEATAKEVSEGRLTAARSGILPTI